MLYAERDENGTITALRSGPAGPGRTPVTESELLEFVAESADSESYKTLLSILDIRLIRVLDDLIDLLVKKNVIMLTELPEEARQKIGERKQIRQRLQESSQLTVDDII